MKILYGVVGEGMGHATRSKVVLEHLLGLGHRVKIVVSGRAYEFLKKSFEEVVQIQGLEISYLDGAMDRDATFAKTVLTAPGKLLDNVGAYYDEVAMFRPDAVISDFESFAYLFGRRHDLPILSIDNQQVISRCWHEPDVLEGHALDFQTTKAFIRLKLPSCEQYIVTTFFYPDIKEKYRANTVLVPPILREAILRATPTDGEHVIVYQTSTSDVQLLEVLQRFEQQKFVVYGLRRDEIRGNCVIKNFAEQGFIDDLASARAVIANGGLSLIGEALALGKPIFSVPVRHQFEQEMNARYLVKLGYGMTSPEMDGDVLGAFLGDAHHFARNIRRTPQHDANAALFAAVDGALASFAKP